MKVICNEGCNKEFYNPEFKEKTIKNDIREVYFKCPYCERKYICFYTNREIRKLQALQRETRDIKKFEMLKNEVTNKMNSLKEYISNNYI